MTWTAPLRVSLLCLLSGCVLSVRGSGERRASPGEAETGGTAASQPAAPRIVSQTVTDEIYQRLFRDARGRLWTVGSDGSDVIVREMAHGRVVLRVTPGDDVHSYSLSPDGDTLFILLGDEVWPPPAKNGLPPEKKWRVEKWSVAEARRVAQASLGSSADSTERNLEVRSETLTVEACVDAGCDAIRLRTSDLSTIGKERWPRAEQRAYYGDTQVDSSGRYAVRARIYAGVRKVEWIDLRDDRRGNIAGTCARFTAPGRLRVVPACRPDPASRPTDAGGPAVEMEPAGACVDPSDSRAFPLVSVDCTFQLVEGQNPGGPPVRDVRRTDGGKVFPWLTSDARSESAIDIRSSGRGAIAWIQSERGGGRDLILFRGGAAELPVRVSDAFRAYGFRRVAEEDEIAIVPAKGAPRVDRIRARDLSALGSLQWPQGLPTDAEIMGRTDGSNLVFWSYAGGKQPYYRASWDACAEERALAD